MWSEKLFNGYRESRPFRFICISGTGGREESRRVSVTCSPVDPLTATFNVLIPPMVHAPDTCELHLLHERPLRGTNSWPFPIATHVPTRKISGHLWGWTLYTCYTQQIGVSRRRRATRNVNCRFLSPCNYALSLALPLYSFVSSPFFLFRGKSDDRYLSNFSLPFSNLISLKGERGLGETNRIMTMDVDNFPLVRVRKAEKDVILYF